MTYTQLSYVHLATVLPAVLLGTFLLFARKGTPLHKLSGKLYMTLMLFTATVTLFMPAVVGPQVIGHFGFIHLFSLLTFFAVFSALTAIRAGNVRRHAQAMVGLYIGGILVAGAFALMPGRMLHVWLFG